MTEPQKPKAIGVIGGGQLARMMLAPGIHLGLEVKVLAETEGSSAALGATMVGDYNQLDVVLAFAATVDVITFDHEHVPLDVLRELESRGISVQPPARALAFAQNKLHMRQRLTELGLPMPNWAEIRTAEQLESFIAQNGGVAILKTPIGGYDGKGVRVVRSAADAADWLSPNILESVGGSLLAEEKVEFSRELAQLSARRPSGEFKSWPLVQTNQQNGVCAEVIAPAPGASADTLQQSADIARTVAEGSVTSQFEQHLRAVSDLPLGSTAARANCAVMVNLLGLDDQNDFVSRFSAAMQEHPTAKFHTYGKSARAGRKMGHVTVLAETTQVALEQARAAAAVLRD